MLNLELNSGTDLSQVRNEVQNHILNGTFKIVTEGHSVSVGNATICDSLYNCHASKKPVYS